MAKYSGLSTNIQKTDECCGTSPENFSAIFSQNQRIEAPTLLIALYGDDLDTTALARHLHCFTSEATKLAHHAQQHEIFKGGANTTLYILSDDLPVVVEAYESLPDEPEPATIADVMEALFG